MSGISTFFHKPHRAKLSSVSRGADVAFFAETGRFTTLLDMAVKARKVLGNIGEFKDLGDEATWEDAQEYRIGLGEVQQCVTLLTRAGLSVALCMPAVDTRVPQYHCIAYYPAARSDDEW